MPSPSNAKEVIAACKRNSSKEINDMLFECKKHYTEARVKVYVISDQLIARNLVYECESSQIHRFPTPKKDADPDY